MYQGYSCSHWDCADSISAALQSAVIRAEINIAALSPYHEAPEQPTMSFAMPAADQICLKPVLPWWQDK